MKLPTPPELSRSRAHRRCYGGLRSKLRLRRVAIVTLQQPAAPPPPPPPPPPPRRPRLLLLLLLLLPLLLLLLLLLLPLLPAQELRPLGSLRSSLWKTCARAQGSFGRFRLVLSTRPVTQSDIVRVMKLMQGAKVISSVKPLV